MLASQRSIPIFRQPTLFDPGAANRLYAEMLGGGALMLETRLQWHVLTYDSVASLPFGALVTSPPPLIQQPSHRIDWLGSRHAVTLLASLDALFVPPPDTGSVTRRPVITAIGAPCGAADARPECRVEKDHAGGAGDPVADVDDLAALVSAGATGSRLSTGAAATPAAALAAARLADVLVFESHAGPVGDGVGLALSRGSTDDGMLTRTKIVAARLRDPVVILAACDTSAIMDRAQDDVLHDLGRAFIAASARRLLLTHYAIADGAGSFVVQRVVAALTAADRPSLAEALRRSIDTLMRDPSTRHLTDPAAWSGFFAAGAPR